MDFGDAIRAMKGGHRVARSGWNGKGMWLALVKNIDAVPAVWAHQFGFLPLGPDETNAVRFLPFIVMKTADNGLVPWLASQTDMLAEDWSIVRSPTEAA